VSFCRDSWRHNRHTFESLFSFIPDSILSFKGTEYNIEVFKLNSTSEKMALHL
jgi:hypothetical protein